MSADNSSEVRRTEQDHLIDVTMLRGFARAALNHDTIQDEINDLLFDHIVDGRYHPTVVADSLRPILTDLLGAMTAADWQAIADELITEACAVLDADGANQ